MAKMIDGQIASIDADIVTDVETLLDYVERWNKGDEERKVANAAQRVADYIEIYKLPENPEEYEKI